METKIFKKLKSHWTAVLFAIVLGLLMILPFFYFQTTLGDEYKGVINQVIDDDLFYMARIKDVMDGHPILGNAYLSEHKNQLPQQLFLPEFLLVQPLKLLNLDVVQGRVLYNFILPVLAFILTYVALYFVYPSRFWANAFAAFLFFGIFLFKFTRPVIPQFVFLFWLTQFTLLWLLIKSKDDDISLYHRISKRWVLLLNVLNFGLLFYLYPFYWTFYLVFFLVLILAFYRFDKNLSKKFLKILIGGALIGFFYFYLTFLAIQLPEYQETLTRLQLVYSRSPSEVKTVLPALLVLILVGILYRLKAIKINREILFFVAGIISIFLVTNQNILTGQKFEFGHYRMMAIFFIVFALYYLFVSTNKVQSFGKFRIWRAGILFIIGFFVFQGVSGYISKILKVSDQDIYAQRYKIIFDWLNENTPKDLVVYTDNNLSELIPVYTANNIFYTQAASLFFISDQEVLERFVLNNYFEKFDRDFVIENERSIWGVRYIDRYGDAVQANKWRHLLGLELKDETRLPEEEINKIIAKAQKIQKSDFEKELKKYRVDYLVWNKEKNPHWLIPDSFEKVFEVNKFAVFKFNFTLPKL